MKLFLIRIRCWAWGEPCWNTLVWRQMLLYHLQSKVAKKRGALLRSTDPEESFLGVTECWCLNCFWLCLSPWQHSVLIHTMENCWDPWLDGGVKWNLVRGWRAGTTESRGHSCALESTVYLGGSWKLPGRCALESWNGMRRADLFLCWWWEAPAIRLNKCDPDISWWAVESYSWVSTEPQLSGSSIISPMISLEVW